MFIKNRQKALFELTEETLTQIKDKIQACDRLVIGAGAGLSASAGLDYMEETFFKHHYPDFYALGRRSIAENFIHYWTPRQENVLEYWGFWVTHINAVYYQQSQRKLYNDLYDLIKGKDYFIITTNGDDQFFKGHYNPSRIFSMQGTYGKFQCQQACHSDLYDNEEMIKNMLKSYDSSTRKIDEDRIPMCPKCGSFQVPNLRIDHNFVENTESDNHQAYIDFLNNGKGSIVFLELGIGFNTPGIIRFPFEEMSRRFKEATLIRVNAHAPQVPEDITNAYGLAVDIKEFINRIKAGR